VPGRAFNPARQMRRHELGDLDFTVEQSRDALFRFAHEAEDNFSIGGSAVLRQSSDDLLTIAATGITVFEALKAADELKKENVSVRVIDCYSIKPIDKGRLIKSIRETKLPVIITVEDHFMHGGLGDFAETALQGTGAEVIKMAVQKISHSGKMEELLKDAGIDAGSILSQVKTRTRKFRAGLVF